MIPLLACFIMENNTPLPYSKFSEHQILLIKQDLVIEESA